MSDVNRSRVIADTSRGTANFMPLIDKPEGPKLIIVPKSKTCRSRSYRAAPGTFSTSSKPGPR